LWQFTLKHCNIGSEPLENSAKPTSLVKIFHSYVDAGHFSPFLLLCKL
jgi:hypothetical protein